MVFSRIRYTRTRPVDHSDSPATGKRRTSARGSNLDPTIVAFIAVNADLLFGRTSELSNSVGRRGQQLQLAAWGAVTPEYSYELIGLVGKTDSVVALIRPAIVGVVSSKHRSGPKCSRVVQFTVVCCRSTGGRSYRERER